MKHIFILSTLLLLYFTTTLFAQSWQQTNGPGGSIIKAATINSLGYIFVASNSLMRSTDNGNSWTQIGKEMPYSSITDIQIKPSGEIFAIVASTLWRSLDDGSSWTHLSQAPAAYSITIMPDASLAIVSDFPNYYTSTDNGNTWIKHSPNIVEGLRKLYGDKAGHLFLSTEKFLYRSTDNGQNWSKVVNGITTYIFSFGEAPNGDLFVSVGGSGPLLFKSIDGGRIWSPVVTAPYFPPDDNYITQIFFSPQGRIVLPYTHNFILISDDSGKNWRKGPLLPPNFPYPYSSEAVAMNNSGVFCLIYAKQRVVISNLDTNLIVQPLDIPTGTVISLIKHPGGNLLAGYWLSTNDGKHWTTLDGGGITQETAIDSAKNILKGADGFIFRSLDSGLTWEKNSLQLTAAAITAIDVRNKSEIFASSSSEGIFRSIDNGVTWDQLNVGIKKQNIFSLAVHQNGDVYAGGQNIIYKSTDVGLTWQQLTTNFPATSGNISQLIVSTQGNIIAVVNGSGVYWSTNDGASWSQKGIGFTTKNINALISTPSGKVFAATDSGVFFLDTLTGAVWVVFNEGLTATNVLSLCRDASGRLYAGTDVSGVFSSVQTFNIANSDVVKPISNNAQRTSLGANYPNPFSSSTTIPFTIGERGYIILDILDQLGRNCTTLAKGYYDAGNYEVKFTGNELSTGSYFARLKTEKQSFIAPLIFVK